MSRARLARVAVDLLLVACGYAVAALVAVLVAVFFMGLPTVLPDQGQWGSFYAFRRDLPALLAFGMFLTALFALPGFVLVQLLARLYRWSNGGLFALAGMANAVLALALYQLSLTGQLLPWTISLPCLPGGLAAGAAYWLAVGRVLARRWDVS